MLTLGSLFLVVRPLDLSHLELASTYAKDLFRSGSSTRH